METTFSAERDRRRGFHWAIRAVFWRWRALGRCLRTSRTWQQIRRGSGAGGQRGAVSKYDNMDVQRQERVATTPDNHVANATEDARMRLHCLIPITFSAARASFAFIPPTPISTSPRSQPAAALLCRSRQRLEASRTACGMAPLARLRPERVLPERASSAHANIANSPADTEMSNIHTHHGDQEHSASSHFVADADFALVDDRVVCPESTPCAARTGSQGEYCLKYARACTVARVRRERTHVAAVFPVHPYSEKLEGVVGFPHGRERRSTLRH